MYILLAIIVLIIIYVVAAYNTFVSLRNRARNAWTDIDVQLKRRHDLVPNLVEIVKGYAAHEKDTLERITQLRSQIVGAQRAPNGAAEEDLSAAIKSVFAVAESYPELKADANFRDLQKQLTEIEDAIQYARRYYNAVVRDFNTKLEMFPSSIIANASGLKKLEYFQMAAEERENPELQFGNGGQR